jgi:hypothetical protein
MASSHEPCDRECSVCHELFTSPKILPCGHLLCRPCLVHWLQAIPRAQCPLYRHSLLDKGVSPPQNWDPSAVDAMFPTDLAMAALVEGERVLNNKEVI